MWIQIVLSILLAVVAVRVIVYSAGHDLVPVVGAGDDYVVRMPRMYLLIGIVLFILAGSLVLSMMVWRTADVLPVTGACAVAVLALIFVLRGAVWRVEVKRKYLIFVSAFGVKSLIHYDDIESAHLDRRGLALTTLLKTYRINRNAIYLENLLSTLADNNVPVYRS